MLFLKQDVGSTFRNKGRPTLGWVNMKVSGASFLEAGLKVQGTFDFTSPLRALWEALKGWRDSQHVTATEHGASLGIKPSTAK